MLYDGLIRLEVGQTLVAGEDVPLKPLIEEAVNGFRQTRGTILASLFDVQNELVLRTLIHEQGVAAVTHQDDHFRARESVLRRATFGVLVRYATPAIVKLYGPHGKAAILRELDEIRIVRDMIAHQPMWLKPVNDPLAGTIEGGVRLRTVAFEVEIADDTSIWTVDEEQVAVWLAAHQNIATTLAARRLDEGRDVLPSAPAAGSPEPLGLFFGDGPINHPRARVRITHHGSPVPDFERVIGAPLKTGFSSTKTIQSHSWTRLDQPAIFDDSTTSD